MKIPESENPDRKVCLAAAHNPQPEPLNRWTVDPRLHVSDGTPCVYVTWRHTDSATTHYVGDDCPGGHQDDRQPPEAPKAED